MSARTNGRVGKFPRWIAARVCCSLAALFAVALITSPASGQRKKAAGSKAASKSAPADWSAVERTLGRKAAALPGGVVRFGFPRSDLSPMLQGVQLRPALALTSWVAFTRLAGGRTMAMGDLVLAEGEVAAVVDRLMQGGVDVVGVHNHLLMEVPPVMYVHISAHGDAEKVAATVRAALQTTRTPMDTAGLSAPVGLIDLDTATIARTLRARGSSNGGVYQVTVARSGDVREDKTVIPASLGISTVLNFQPTGAGRSAATGDFVLTASEVEPVISALRKGGIEVTALHNHMLTEQPRLFFLHFWAHDDTATIAAALRAGLDAMSKSGRR